MSDKKRKTFTVEEKSSIIFRLEAGESNREIAKELGVSHSTISTIFKNKEKIEKCFEEQNLKTKKIRKSHHEDIESCLLGWFKTQRKNNIAVNGPLLQLKSNEFARRLGKNDFECSPAWIQRFRLRHNIVVGKVSGEGASVNPETVSDWLQKVWPTLREKYTDDEIFNIDETGLFFKMTPERTLKFKGEKCVGGKMSKERITVLVGANMTGTEKLRLLVIGKSKNPRCFKNIKNLPVDYESNKKAWMTSEIFTSYLRKWDNKLKARSKKILLLLDNCPAHPAVENLQAIKLCFMPPNTTSHLQPMDQGIIRSLKEHYRKLHILHIIQNDGNSGKRDINLLDAILLLADAWNRVMESTISNCYHHAGFKLIPVNQQVNNEFSPDDEIPLSVLAEQLTLMQNFGEVCNWDDFVMSDFDIITTEELTDNDIVASVLCTEENSVEDCEEEGDEFEDCVLPTTNDALSAIETLQKYYLTTSTNLSEEAQRTIDKMKRQLEKDFLTRKRQTIITDYFL